MRKSEELMQLADNEFDQAEQFWKEDNTIDSSQSYLKANFLLMEGYLECNGIPYYDEPSNIHRTFEKIIKNESDYVDSYAMEFHYLDQFYNKKGYFKVNPLMDEQLRQDFIKVYYKLLSMLEKAINSTEEDKIVAPDDLEGFISDIGVN